MPILVTIYYSMPCSFKKAAHFPMMCLKLLIIPSSLFPVSVYLFRFVLSMNPLSQRTCSKPFSLASHHKNIYDCRNLMQNTQLHSLLLVIPLVGVDSFYFRFNSKAERFLSLIEVVPKAIGAHRKQSRSGDICHQCQMEQSKCNEMIEYASNRKFKK